jgi:hypothetical protein
LLRPLNTVQAPFAAIERPFSKYLMGACMRQSPLGAKTVGSRSCK